MQARPGVSGRFLRAPVGSSARCAARPRMASAGWQRCFEVRNESALRAATGGLRSEEGRRKPGGDRLNQPEDHDHRSMQNDVRGNSSVDLFG